MTRRILLTGHSHQAWPDVARAALLQCFDDAALHVDDKWGAAFAAVDVNSIKSKDRSLNVNRNYGSRAKRRSSADQISGPFIRPLRCCGFDGFDANMTSEILGRNLSVTMHKNDDRLLFIGLENNSFYYRVFIDSELFRRFRSTAFFNIFI